MKMTRRISGGGTRALLATITGMVLVAGGLAGPANGAVTSTPRPIGDAAAEARAAEAIIEEFNRTGLVEGSEAPTVRNDFKNEAPAEVFELADELRERFEGTEGYGPVQWVKESREVKVWWHGEVPAQVAELVEQASAVTAAPIEMESMKYSTAELAVAAQEILAAQGGDNGTVQTVTALFDGSGLEVATLSDWVVQRRSTEVTSDELGARGSYPVEVVQSGAVEPANNRQAGQYAPYSGGGRINFVGGGGCTSAFGVMIREPRADRNKPRGMLTAHHCGNYGPGNWVTPSSAFYGYKASEYSSLQRDASVLVNSENLSGVPDTYPIYFPFMYVGTYTGGSRYVVVSGSTPVIGADWCFSGSYSGTHCYNEITQTNTYANYGSPATNVGPLVQTVNYLGINSVGQGDSGGPAYRYANSTGNGVFATGIISGIRNGANTCEGQQYNGRLCSTVALISPIYGAIGNLNGGLQLMTSTNY